MRAAQAILFPWQGTFKRLGLRNRWWHRLAVVVFFVALVPALGIFWAVAYAVFQPVHPYMPDVQHWATDTEGKAIELTLGRLSTQADVDQGLPKENLGFPLLDVPPGKFIDPAAKMEDRLDMPDGVRREFIGESDQEIKTEWNKALKLAIRKQWCLGFLIGIAITLVLSYLLQAFYRALLYVVYGQNVDEGLTQIDDRSWAGAVDAVQAHTGPGKRHTWVR